MNLQILMKIDDKTQQLDLDNLEIQKMLFIYNALEDGWKVEKEKNTFVFIKPHEKKKEYFTDDYLKEFIKKHFRFLK
jgi:predicted RNA-binding protein (virulence factor B family)